jgi:hypothetical protein
VQVRKNEDYIPSNDTIKHVDEVLKLMAALTGDHRFENYQNETQKGGSIKMCEVLDKIENRGIAKGRAEGKIYGMVKVYVNDMHLSAEEISLKLNRDIEEIKDIMSKIE